MSRDGNALQSEAASSIGSGISIVGKIIGAQIEGEVSAEDLTVGGYVKGTLHANRVTVNSTAVVKGDIFHRTLMIEGSDASMKSARAIVRWNR